jgi:hypothetical protein
MTRLKVLPDAPRTRAEREELLKRWVEARDLDALRWLLDRNEPPDDLLSELKRALDDYILHGVDLAVALGRGGRGRHAKPRTRDLKALEVEYVYGAVLAAESMGWGRRERFRYADALLEYLRHSLNGYPPRDPRRIPYIRGVYYRRRGRGPLRFDVREIMTIGMQIAVPVGPNPSHRVEREERTGNYRVFENYPAFIDKPEA